MGEGMMSSAHQDTLKRGRGGYSTSLEPLKMKRIFMPGQAAAVTEQRIDQRYTLRRHTHTQKQSRSASNAYIYSVINSCQPHPHPLLYIFPSSFFLIYSIHLSIFFFFFFSFLYFYSRRELFQVSSFFFHPATPFRLYYYAAVRSCTTYNNWQAPPTFLGAFSYISVLFSSFAEPSTIAGAIRREKRPVSLSDSTLLLFFSCC